MRVIGLLVATVLFPFVAYAATVNINTADAALLDTLQGIGPTKAAAIVDYRTKNGPFAVIEDIQNVTGIGPATFANIKASITVGPVSAAPAPSEQPPAPKPSSHTVQAVEPITSATTNIQAHEEAVDAPAAANELSAAGAPLPEPVTPHPRASGLFSVWTLGLLGVIVVAGGAFILL